jgi:hypothetical protein
MSRVASVMPFFPHGDTKTALRLFHRAIEVVRHYSEEVWVIQDGVDIIAKSSSYHLVTLWPNVGKTTAVRNGFREAMESPRAHIFAVCDWDDEQDLHDLPVLIEMLANRSSNIVIGNRYAYFAQNETPPHRLVANYLQKLLAARLGFDATDLGSGLTVCDRSFAELFVNFSKTPRFGMGFDWTILAFLHEKKVMNAPIHARMRAPFMNGDKIVENFGAPLRYTEELERKGKQEIVAFCRHLVNALYAKCDRVQIRSELIGGDRPCVAIRDGDNYSFAFV